MITIAYRCEPYNGDFRTTFMSQNTRALLGFEPHALAAPLFRHDRVHPEDSARVPELLPRLFQPGTVHWEYRFRRSDGAYRWLAECVNVLPGSEGRPRELVGVVADMTSERNYRSLFDNIDLGIIQCDARAAIAAMNPAAETILGVSLEELAREDPRAAEDRRQWLLMLLSRKELRHLFVDVFNPRRNERLRVRTNVVPLFIPGDHRPREFFVTFEDITDRIRAEESLQRERAQVRAGEERFRALIEHSSEIVCLFDAAGTIRYASPSAQSILGYHPGEVVGSSVFDFIHPDDVPRALQALQLGMATPGRGVSVEFRFRHRDGRWRYLEAVGSNLYHVGEIAGVVVNARDITGRKRMERKLERSRDQLRRLAARLEAIREQERTRIAREIHDELGQVLTGLKMEVEGLAARMSRPDRPSGDAPGKLAAVAGLAEGAIRFVQRITAELRPGVLDHLGLAAAMRWQATEFQARTSIQCRLSGLDRDLPLNPDQATAVFRTFQEILTNVARHASARTVTVRAELTPRWFRLEVADDGKGLEARHLSDPNSLGLLGMRERALLLGGSITFKGAKGKGTLIRLRIPTRAPRPAAGPARRRKEDRALTPL